MTQPVRTAPTLAEVAAAAGVSRSTASRALNDSPRISEETKKRVRAAAKKVNFVPNARGRALAVGRTEIIAVLVTEPLNELFGDPTYSEFLSGITEELSELSYLPVILQASSSHERNRAREHFERRSFDAVIDVSPYKGSELLEVLRELGVPTVLCGQLEGHPYRDVFSTVYSDDEEGGRFAALAMKDRGRKDIVAVLGPQDNPAVVDRLRGYRAILGESLPNENVIYTGWSSGDGYQATRRLLASEIHADGVLCGSDRIATGVIAAFNEAGISVPKDVSVVGFDDHEVAARSVPALTTIRQPLREEGRMAAGIALDMINGAAPTTTVMHMQLVQRDSL